MQPSNIILETQIKSKTSDNVYTVVIFDNAIACTCPAGGKKQICKHMVSVVHENLEYIKEKAPAFFDALMNAIQVKFDKNILSREEKMKEYAKVVYLDKNIASISVENIKGIEISDKKELEQFKAIAKNCRLYVFHNFLNTARKSPYNIFFASYCTEIKELADIGFIKILPVTYEDYKENTYFTKDILLQKFKEQGIEVPKSKTKQFLMELAAKNNLFKEDMKNYCLIYATELFTTSKDIISYLYKNSSDYDENKKIINIKFLREDTSIPV